MTTPERTRNTPYVTLDNPLPPAYGNVEYGENDFFEPYDTDVTFSSDIADDRLLREALEERLREQYGDSGIAISEDGNLTAGLDTDQAKHFMRTYTAIVEPDSSIVTKHRQEPHYTTVTAVDGDGVETWSEYGEGPEAYSTQHTRLSPVDEAEIIAQLESGDAKRAEIDGFVNPAYAAWDASHESESLREMLTNTEYDPHETSYLDEVMARDNDHVEVETQPSVWDRLQSYQGEQVAQPDKDAGLER